MIDLTVNQLTLLLSYIPADQQEIKKEIQQDFDYKTRDQRSLSTPQLTQLKQQLLEYVLYKKPSDLTNGMSGEDWFFKNNRGQSQWNWRNSNSPLKYLADINGVTQLYLNSNQADLHKITQQVKNHILVKPIKQRCV